MQTVNDVGDVPGRESLTDAQKQIIADERNAEAAGQESREWESEMLRLDRELMSDARYFEELADGLVSIKARDRMSALVAERKQHRSKGA